MSVDLQALYQEAILDHSRRPRNFRAMEAGRKAEGYNRICGDRVTVHLRVEGEVIRDASFQGSGCAIVRASASLMTESVRGRTVADAVALIERYRGMITAPPGAPIENLGALSALAGVRLFPTRIKCANLPWEALHAAIAGREDLVSTE